MYKIEKVDFLCKINGIFCIHWCDCSYTSKLKTGSKNPPTQKKKKKKKKRKRKKKRPIFIAHGLLQRKACIFFFFFFNIHCFLGILDGFILTNICHLSSKRLGAMDQERLFFASLLEATISIHRSETGNAKTYKSIRFK